MDLKSTGPRGPWGFESLALRHFLVVLALLTVAAACTSARPADAPARVRPGFLTHAGKPNVVVFVHGVTGDAAATWRNPATGASWPEMITRDPELADFDVYLAGFDSPLLGRSSTIEEIAQRLLVQITDDGVFDRYAQVHFITHSMGGLITKRMLVELNRPQPREQDRLRRVRAVLFVSTPAQGAEVAKIGAWLSQNPQFANMEPATFNAFLQSLENQWQALLRDRDERDVPFPRVFCAYETKPLAAGVVVVSRVYAATRCDDTPIAFDADHSAIVKPADERTQPYPWARARLRETSRLPAVAVGRGREFRLTVELSEVVNDARGRQIEAHRFTGPAAGEAPDATLDEAAAWLATRLGQIYELDRPQATFRVRVPADPGREPVVVERIGEAPVDIELYLVEGGAKARMPL